MDVTLQREDPLAVASCQAGLAFTKAGVGYVHAISHQIGAIYHLPHGLVNAVVLPYVLDFYLDEAADSPGGACTGVRAGGG